MLERSQLSLFENEESEKSRCYQGGSLASLTALQESVWHLLTSVIYGENLQESFAKLSQDGCWLKTYQGYLQASLDGSLEEYSKTWPKWGMMRRGVLYAQAGLEPYIDESGYSLLPTLVASEERPTSKKKISGEQTLQGGESVGGTKNLRHRPMLFEPKLCRNLHGFPSGAYRLKCLGNAVVPQQVYPILQAIVELEVSHD